MGKIVDIATGMIAFTGFLGVMFAMVYYIYQIKNLNIIEAIMYIVTYINANLLFFYILMRLTK